MTGYLVIQWSSHFNAHQDGLNERLLQTQVAGLAHRVSDVAGPGWGGKRSPQNCCVPETTLSLARTTSETRSHLGEPVLASCLVTMVTIGSLCAFPENTVRKVSSPRSEQ